MPIRRAVHNVMRWTCVMAMAAMGGGTTFIASGCDTSVSTTVLGGFQDLSTTLLDAIFLQIAADLESQTTDTTTTTSTDTTSTDS